MSRDIIRSLSVRFLREQVQENVYVKLAGLTPNIWGMGVTLLHIS